MATIHQALLMCFVLYLVLYMHIWGGEVGIFIPILKMKKLRHRELDMTKITTQIKLKVCQGLRNKPLEMGFAIPQIEAKNTPMNDGRKGGREGKRHCQQTTKDW